jgi:acetyl esterase/lipase
MLLIGDNAGFSASFKRAITALTSFTALAMFFFCAPLSGCATAGLYKDAGDAPAESVTKHQPSVSYRMLETMVKMSGYKKIYSGDVEMLKARAEKNNDGKPNSPPKNFYRRFAVTEETIQGRSCFFISPKQNARKDAAVFFLYGGGFMLDIDSFHWAMIERIVGELSIPVCVPLYPIYPETNPDTVITFVYESFALFCEANPEARITGLGDSSGAYLLLSFCHYLTDIKGTAAARFPDRLICVSPAQIVGIDEATLNKMKEIDKKDIALSVAMLESLSSLFDLRNDEFNWFSAPLFGDFGRFPPMTVFAGTDDIFYPLILPFVERVRSQGKAVELYTGDGMMHVWPFMPIALESKQAMNVILEIIDGKR